MWDDVEPLRLEQVPADSLVREFAGDSAVSLLRGIDSGGTGNFCGSVPSSATASKPSGGIRLLHSLSACGLPTPVVDLACIGNVDIQVFFYVSGQLYFTRRLQVYI